MLITFVGAIAGLGLALLRKTTYTSTFSFLPTASQDGARAGLSSLAGQFGVSLGALTGSTQSPQLYADLIVASGVLRPIAEDSFSLRAGGAKIPLPEILRVKGPTPPIVVDNTIRALRRDVIGSLVAVRTTGLVTITVRTQSAQASFELAQRLIAGLNTFNLQTRQSQAREERRFTEARYESARNSLRTAEDGLQRFLQANRQFGSASQLLFERERLQREVSLQQQLVLTLAQQYEDARIREVRDTPLITVIESPAVPQRPDARLRGLFIVLGAFFGMIVAVFFVLVRDAWTAERRDTSNPAFALLSAEWQRIRRRSPA